MTFTGLGLEARLEIAESQPQIYDPFPEVITIGETRRLDIWGNTLRPDNVSPTVTIAGQSVPVEADSNERVVVDVTNLTFPEGSDDRISTNLVLAYGNGVEARAIVWLARPVPEALPADLILTSLELTPSSPLEEGNTEARITTCNQGEGPAREFVVQWRPEATHPGYTILWQEGLPAGECRSFSFNHAYLIPGEKETVAIVDVFNNHDESDETNNSLTRTITVQPAEEEPPPPPTRPPITLSCREACAQDRDICMADGETLPRVCVQIYQACLNICSP